jgi:hypothetical protein
MALYVVRLDRDALEERHCPPLSSDYPCQLLTKAILQLPRVVVCQKINRTTTRGTVTETFTPVIGSESGRLVAPTSGAVLDTTFSTQPTKEAVPLY